MLPIQPWLSFLTDVPFNFKEAVAGADERGRPPLLAEINMILSAASRGDRHTIQREMRCIT